MHWISVSLLQLPGTILSPKRQSSESPNTKLLPTKVTAVPPLTGPLAGLMDDITASSINSKLTPCTVASTPFTVA